MICASAKFIVPLTDLQLDMLSYARRKMWFWHFVHYWSIIRLRRRVIFGSAVIGVLIAMSIMAITTPVYSSRAVISVPDLDADGFVTRPGY
jgi:hypothetical protein